MNTFFHVCLIRIEGRNAYTCLLTIHYRHQRVVFLCLIFATYSGLDYGDKEACDV